MIVKIPRSLFMEMLANSQTGLQRFSNKTFNEPDPTEATMQGPYGKYTIVSVPDEEYCEEVQVKALRYRD